MPKGKGPNFPGLLCDLLSWLVTETSLNTGQPGTGVSDMLVSSFKSNLLFLFGSPALNVTWLCSSGRSMMSLSLNPDPVTR